MQQTNFRKLRVWQEAHEFVKMIYRITEDFPKGELLGLVSQLRRAAVSIPANIVEGYAYNSDRKLLQYLNISKGSLAESEYYLQLVLDLNYINPETYGRLESQREKVSAYLTNFIKAIKKSNNAVKQQSSRAL